MCRRAVGGNGERMAASHFAAALVVFSLFSLARGNAHGQQPSAHDLVQSIVANELKMDANDHSRWMYQDTNKSGGKNTVKLVVQTPEGSVSRTIEINGHPLNAQQKRMDERKMHRFVADPSLRQKQKQSDQHDDKQAASLTKMLPDAFLWKVVSTEGDETTLAFQPNPKFHPPTRESKVFAAMQGTMVVNTKQKRIQSLKGELIHNVDFGWGLLGKLQKGGTFNVERTNIDGDVWEITQTHVHIRGHALIFKSINEQQDEVTSHYKAAPESITLQQAAKSLNDGKVAKEIGVEMPQ
jgi:hypothetical protein